MQILRHKKRVDAAEAKLRDEEKEVHCPSGQPRIGPNGSRTNGETVLHYVLVLEHAATEPPIQKTIRPRQNVHAMCAEEGKEGQCSEADVEAGVHKCV